MMNSTTSKRFNNRSTSRANAEHTASPKIQAKKAGGSLNRTTMMGLQSLYNQQQQAIPSHSVVANSRHYHTSSTTKN
jgi:hypothetical protein